LDEHGAWRRAVVRRLHLGAGTGPPRLAAEVEACLQQHRERPEPDGEKATVNFPRAMAIGSRLHLERKP